MIMMPKANYRFNAVPFKLTFFFFLEIEKGTNKLHGISSDHEEPKNVLKKTILVTSPFFLFQSTLQSNSNENSLYLA